MSTKLNFPSADQDVFIRGDDAAKRVITLGQLGSFRDDVVIASDNWSVTAAGVATFGGNVTFNAGLTSPKSGSTSSERFGLNAAGAATSAFGLTVFGNAAGGNVTTGDNNAFFGLNAGAGVTTGSQCSAFGVNAMTAANADDQTAFGYNAMRYSNGANNIAFGSGAMAGSQVTPHTGQFNTAFGTNVMLVIEGNTWNNAGFGGRSLQALTTGIGNNCFGKDTGLVLTTGGSNCIFGNGAGNTVTTGSSNILIGAGVITTSATSNQELKISYAGGSTIPIISGRMGNASGENLMGVNMNPADIDATLHVTTDNGDAVACLKLEQDDADQAFIDLEGTSAANLLNSLTTFTTSGTPSGHFKITVNGADRWVPFVTTPSA